MVTEERNEKRKWTDNWFGGAAWLLLVRTESGFTEVLKIHPFESIKLCMLYFGYKNNQQLVKICDVIEARKWRCH